MIKNINQLIVVLDIPQFNQKFENICLGKSISPCYQPLVKNRFERTRHTEKSSLKPFKLSDLKSWAKIKPIEEEIEGLSIKDTFDFQYYRTCLTFENLREKKQKKLINYLEGSLRLTELGIRLENANEFLKFIKLFDLAVAWHNKLENKKIIFKKTTHKIRLHILKLLSPQIKSCEVYTWTLNKNKFEDFNYLKETKNWLPERVKLYGRLVANYFIYTRSLSTRLKEAQSTLYAIRGNTGSGKTTKIKQEVELKPACNEQGEIIGILNPDFLKLALKCKSLFSTQLFLTNKQVHDEGSALFDSYRQAVLKLNLTCILDTRCIALDFIEESIIEPTKQRKGQATLIDLDVPLLTSLNRNLCRNPYGTDPCVALEAITTGFMQIREHRLNLIEKIKGEKAIKHYKLYHLNDKGILQLSAEKIDKTFSIFSQSSFETCTQPISNHIVNQQIEQVITQAYIEEAITRGDIPSHQENLLAKWKGKTVKEAISLHVEGKNAN